MLGAIDPALVARAPLLSARPRARHPGHRADAALDAKLRKASLEDLLAVALRARSAEQPIILVLEDCHWIDALSRDLLEVLCRAAAALPVLIVLAYRPAPEPGGGLGVERIPGFSGDVPRQLSGDDAAALIRVEARAGRGRDRRCARARRSDAATSSSAS